MKPGQIIKDFNNIIYEDIPNVGYAITLDNKGRLINSQFSKPSSQTLLKLNVTDEIPDADDLPYSVISYGDTPNIINLPYNDHNYVTFQNTTNYDRTALEYLSKQSSNISTKNHLSAPNPIRISHFNSYNSCNSQNESVFINDKYKVQHQYVFNNQITQASTPIVTKKSMSNMSRISNVYATNKVLPGTIVINSGSVNNLKSMNIIKLHRPTIEAVKTNDTRIINLPAKKPSVLTNIIGNNQINGDKDKLNASKAINLVPRCICGFMHDDGGMIRCEICRTWQHIVCMYPDNKFPVYYKCERCQPRDVDVKRAVTTQSNILNKTGYNPHDFIARRECNDYDLDNDSTKNVDLENKFNKSNGSHFVIVQQDKKSRYCSLSESIPNTPLPIYITAAKDTQMVPPGSPRTSKRKQDLINLKTVLTKPIHNNKIDALPKQLTIDNQNVYSCVSSYPIPTSLQKYHQDSIESYTIINEMSSKVKTILSSKVQFHTNLNMFHLQYLKQNTFEINTNMYEVITIDFSKYAVKAVVEFNADEVIMEYNGYVSLAEEYNKEYDFRKYFNPYALFYDKCDHLPLCVDAQSLDTKARYVRRSCTPNAEVKHRLLQDGQIKFYIVPINRIYRDAEITIAFDYNFMKCRYSVECACKQPSCQLVYLKRETEAQSQRDIDDINGGFVNPYEYVHGNFIADDVRAPVSTTRPYKKRGRGPKTLGSTCRPTITDNNSYITSTKPDVGVVRRNKRGRPPLNRSTGIQRADVIARPIPETTFNKDVHELRHSNESESENNSVNDSYISQIPIHTNFKNFKRISSNHWSLKNNRKMAALAKKAKPLNTLLTKAKVGRPVKLNKKKVIHLKKEVDCFSDYSNHSQARNPLKVLFDEGRHTDSNDENNDNVSEHSAREDEGKYWLEEINNKIQKQKVKEAKHVKHRGKYTRKKIQKEPPPVAVEEPVEIIVKSPVDVYKEENLECPEPIDQQSPVVSEHEIVHDEPKEQHSIPKKQKRGRKPLKSNTNYILSYKPSNIDDLKNDLMLISASLDEKEEEEPSTLKEESYECVQEVVVDDCPVVAVDSEDCVQQHSLTESDHSARLNDSSEEPVSRSRIKKDSNSRHSSEGARDSSTKASREDRWVNIMWQRILKNETTTPSPDEKLKRRRSKSSAAEESVASEDNRNELSEIGSPKVTNSELIDDRESSYCNSKFNKRSAKSSSANDCDSQQSIDTDVAVLMTIANDDPQLVEGGEPSEQCGLIVYKEQHSNPMEKFSRENSAKIISPESGSEGAVTSSYVGNQQCHAHTKKRWLNQALLEETDNGKSGVEIETDVIDKFSSIDRVSKHSFLPPVFTSPDSNNHMTTSVQKFAINPKKRLLNQFSMEDSSQPTSTYSGFKLNKLDSNLDQTKTKLTLSEYRKRRFIDKVPNEVTEKCQKSSDDFNSAWIGIANLTPKIEKLTEEERTVSESSNGDLNVTKEFETNVSMGGFQTNVEVVNKQEPVVDVGHSSPVSYLETLNNLPMPENLDPRLSILSHKSLFVNVDIDLPIIHYRESIVAIKNEICEPKSPPDDCAVGASDPRLARNGPRTPSESGDVPNNSCNITFPTTDHHSAESIHSFESQPSPTSDSHFDFEDYTNTHSTVTHEHMPADWTSHTASIGRMAGIKNPELLQEIDEFDDEYVPMPVDLPQRSQEELETLLLTQKRDSQIREWQEVKQIERQKVKLHHQVRHLERRLLRCNKRPKSGHSLEERIKNYDVKDDEKTMKTFNVQLARINDRLQAQIQSARGETDPLHSSSYSRHRRKPVVHIDQSEIALGKRVVPPAPPSSNIKSDVTPAFV